MNIINKFLQIKNQLDIFHWKTESYAQHKAFEDAYGDLSPLIDDFVEILIAKVGRDKMKVDGNLDLEDLTSESEKKIDENFIEGNLYFLENITKTGLVSEKDYDLLNIRDEMIAALNKLAYKLTLK